jgi:hypothetical protein
MLPKKKLPSTCGLGWGPSPLALLGLGAVTRPGRPLGQLLSAAGRRLESVVDRTAARAGLGFEGIARRLLMKLRAPHARCRSWSDFAKTPVVHGACCRVGQRDLSWLRPAIHERFRPHQQQRSRGVSHASCGFHRVSSL